MILTIAIVLTCGLMEVYAMPAVCWFIVRHG